MKKNVLSGLLSMAIVCGIGAYSIASAADAPAPKAEKPPKAEKASKADAAKPETIKGTVVVTKDDKGAVKECSLKTADGTMYLCSPEAQCKLLEAEDGKVVECTGGVTVKDGQKHLHIKSINAHPTP